MITDMTSRYGDVTKRHREHLKGAKKPLVGWRSLCGASERLAKAESNRERDAPTVNLRY
jgi:hypothetical protein